MNTLDQHKPASQVLTVFPVNSSSIAVKTTGSDAMSGVKHYQLWMLGNGSAFYNMVNIRKTVTSRCKLSTTYSFYVVTSDAVGNVPSKTPGA